MGTPGRRTDPSVAEQLLEEGYRFDFFQAVRLLERVYPNRRAVGREGPPGDVLMRSLLYALAKLLGDVNAVKKKRIGRRLWRRAVGRWLGRLFRW